MFRMQGKFLTNIKNHKVMDVSSNRDVENQNIHMWKKHGGLNQQWDIIYANQWKREPTKGELNKRFGMYVDRTFFIISRMGGRRYMDILGRNIVIKTRNGRKTQKWYFHQQSLSVRSRSNNQSFDIVSSGKGKNLQVSSTNSRWH
jgi:hypothetical protein